MLLGLLKLLFQEDTNMIRPLQELSSWIHWETATVSIGIHYISMQRENMLYSYQLMRCIFPIMIPK